MKTVVLTGVLVAALLALQSPAAADESWTFWNLESRSGSAEGVDGWALAFSKDGRLSTSWVGPMHPSKGSELTTLEGLETLGTYERDGGRITFRTEEVGDGWLWEWSTVACETVETEKALRLSNCLGSGWPDWVSADPPQPEEMSFIR